MRQQNSLDLRDGVRLSLGRGEARGVPADLEEGGGAGDRHHDGRDDSEHRALAHVSETEDQTPHHGAEVAAGAHDARHGARRVRHDVRHDPVRGTLGHLHAHGEEDEDRDGRAEGVHEGEQEQEGAFPQEGGPLCEEASAHAGHSTSELGEEEVCVFSRSGRRGGLGGHDRRMVVERNG